MKLTLRGVSGAALLFGLAGVASAQTVQTTQLEPTGPQAAPQQTQTPDQTQTQQPAAQPDRVTVIGSFLATAPEDAPKPVEVVTAQELREQGSPNITEFIRSLTAVAPNTTGTASTSTSAGILANGFNSVDLRGQGANGTLVLFNGRRLASTNGGAGADVNTIPMAALEAVEILKDGASATYGAGAVGGVINFRTRRDIDAPQINLTTTLYDGSDSNYKIDFLTGWVGDTSNVLFSVSHEEEGSLMATERDFSTQPYNINPDGWAIANLPNRFHAYRNWAGATPTATGSFNDFISNADCATLGGRLLQDLQQGTGATTPTSCAFPLAPVSELVSEFTQDQAYFEFNADITDTMEVHFNTLYSKYESTGKRPPSSGVGTARAMDSSVSAFCAASCFYLVPFQQSLYTVTGALDTTRAAVVNPFVANFNARQPGTTNDIAAADALLTSANWRPYLFGGNPLFSDGLARTRVQRERFQVNAGLKGEFAGEGILGKLLEGVTYDYNGQFTQYVQTNAEAGDWLVNRLQDAIMGYGGADCRAIDRVRTDYTSAATFNRTIGIQSDIAPGTNGCKYFNPFQSNFQSSIFNGAANPSFPTTGPAWTPGMTQAGNTGAAGYLNDIDLLDWIWATRPSEIQYQSLTFDALFTGQVPETMFKLPGGEIGWAAGAQWRQNERRGLIIEDNQEERILLQAACPYEHQGQNPQRPLAPGQTPTSRGCTGVLGTGNFFSGVTSLQPNPGLVPPDFIDSQTIAYFGEIQLPILDNLNLSASLRHESFNGGDVKGTIYGLAGKWDVTDNIYMRASYSTNFRAEAAIDAVPGQESVTLVTDTTRFGTFPYVRITTTDQSIEPEEDVTMNFGTGFQGEVFGGRLRASIDYFRIEREGEVLTTSNTRVLDEVFGTPRGTSLTTNPVQANCASGYASYIRFDNGCVQGSTTANNIVAVLSAEANGPSFTTDGIDYAIDYSFDLFGGRFGANFQATQVLTYEAGEFLVGGFAFDDGGDRLGFRNTNQTGSPSQELRANATLRWSNDMHSFSLRGNFQAGMAIDNDPAPTRTPIINYPTGGLPDVFSGYGWGAKDYIDYDFTYIFTAPFWEELDLRFSVLNITDRDPIADQALNGYLVQMGNPRGRRIELGLSKKF